MMINPPPTSFVQRLPYWVLFLFQGNMEAFEGIQIVKERKRDDLLVAPE
jgi:hypothetical protein